MPGCAIFSLGNCRSSGLDEYIATMPHQHNVRRIPVEGFEYLWDMSSELVQQGIVPASAAVDDRLIAAHGPSRPAAKAREGSRLRGRTLGPVSVVDRLERLPYDRGHAIGHALSGVLGLNIIPQTRAVNCGGLWRQMERYCQEHRGTYFFCRPIDAGLSSHPKELDFGVLCGDGSLWAHSFQNCGATEELETFECLYRERIGSRSRRDFTTTTRAALWRLCCRRFRRRLGQQYCYRNYTTRTSAVTLKAPTSTYIDYAGSNSSSGGTFVSAGATGDEACVIPVSMTQYMGTVRLGTWSVH
jgi:hypothetical protein